MERPSSLIAQGVLEPNITITKDCCLEFSVTHVMSLLLLTLGQYDSNKDAGVLNNSELGIFLRWILGKSLTPREWTEFHAIYRITLLDETLSRKVVGRKAKNF